MTLCEQRELLTRAIRGVPPGQPAALLPSGAPAPPPEPEIINRIITAAAAGDNTLIAAQPGTIELLQLILINSAAQTLSFLSGPTLLQVLPAFAAGEGYELVFAPGLIPYWRIPAGNALILNLSVGTRVDGFLNYRVKT
jgi:hypothetical protein